MNKLSELQIDELLEQYEVSRSLVKMLEEIFSETNFEEDEYYSLITDIVSEYQSLKINKRLKSELAKPFKNLKDVILKVLEFKLKGMIYDNSKYEKEVNLLIYKLNDKKTH